MRFVDHRKKRQAFAKRWDLRHILSFSPTLRSTTNLSLTLNRRYNVYKRQLQVVARRWTYFKDTKYGCLCSLYLSPACGFKGSKWMNMRLHFSPAHAHMRCPPCTKKSDVLITEREVEQMEREQRKYDNAHMKEKPFKLGGDMKDSLSLLSLSFASFCSLSISPPPSSLPPILPPCLIIVHSDSNCEC